MNYLKRIIEFFKRLFTRFINLFKKEEYKPIDLNSLQYEKKKLKHQKISRKGAFGKQRNIIDAKQKLRVLPKSKRTKDNCNECGVEK